MASVSVLRNEKTQPCLWRQGWDMRDDDGNHKPNRYKLEAKPMLEVVADYTA